MTRRYLDPKGVVHDAYDIGRGARATRCEINASGDTIAIWDTNQLSVTRRGFTTCLQCLALQSHPLPARSIRKT